MARKILFLAAAFAMVMSMGCSRGGDNAPGAVTVKPVKPAHLSTTPRAASAPAEAASGGWAYDPSTRLDPFQVPAPPAVTKSSRDFELEQMALIGIIKGADRANALLIMPDGSARVVHPGDRLGASNGVVTRIGKNHIEVEESYIQGPQTFIIVKTMNIAGGKGNGG